MKINHNIPVSKLFNEKGHLTDEGAAYYAENLWAGNLENLPETLRRHVEGCESCKQDCLELVEIINQSAGEEIGDTEEVESICSEPEEEYLSTAAVHKNGWINVLRYAALVAGVVGLGYVIVMGVRKMRKEETAEISRKTETSDAGQQSVNYNARSDINAWVRKWSETMPQFTERFRPNASLENIMKLAFRSDEFQMIRPDSISEYYSGQEITFQWKNTTAKACTLRFLDREGNVVHQRLLKHQDMYTLPKRLPAGLYYWFVDQENHTVAAGRTGILEDQ